MDLPPWFRYRVAVRFTPAPIETGGLLLLAVPIVHMVA